MSDCSYLPTPPVASRLGASVGILLHYSLITSHSALPPNILSVQSSKGLEFRSVIFIGLGQMDDSAAATEQNMKLLYVGMTRAKEHLLITATGRNDFTARLEAMTGKTCAVA